ncbi:hypothetical protein M8A51_18780 [Schlegelella sp. S2-27]|uniref:Secreted protein n=1 Tax=Caldimonas mangrovi TaxID=2944811 RepID=A0ABT0YS53_9BURK|nr:hypothetical protein [Caldimonas mangrovi]
MLLLQALVLALDFTQPLQLGHLLLLHRLHLAHQFAVAHLLAPLRQHERVNAQGLGHVLDQHARLIAHLHGLELELDAVAIDLLRSWSSQSTLPFALGESVNQTDASSTSPRWEYEGTSPVLQRRQSAPRLVVASSSI